MFGMIVGLLFGLYVMVAVLHVVGVIIGAVFSGVGVLLGGVLSGIFSLAGHVFSAEGIGLGIILGLAWYFLRNGKRTARSNI